MVFSHDTAEVQNSSDLDQSIDHFEHALDICPMDHPCRPAALFNLATAKFLNCQANETYLDLNIPISIFQDALDLRPTGHPDRPVTQLHLAIALLYHFAKRGIEADHNAAKELLSEEWPATSMLPISLNQLVDRVKWCLQRDDPHALDEVISLHYDALDNMHACRRQLLGNLDVMLATRFEHRGSDEDLDQAITLQSESLALHPVGHPDRSSSLNNLANQLFTRFGHRGNAKDLDQAIALHREALALRPVGHTLRSSSLDNLAVQFSTRFDHRGNVEDLDEAIALHREALALCPVGHTDRPMLLNNLANRLSTRFDHRGDAEDLNGPGEDTESLNVAMHHFEAAANFVPGGLLFRLRASLSWVHHADLHRHGTELEAYETSMQLMDAYMSATASISSRHSAMKDFPNTLAADAASCALRSGDVRRAVELLEQGRTIIWTQMTRLRTPLDSLQTHSDHAAALVKRFRDLSSLLDKPPAIHVDGSPSVDVEAAATRYRRLVENWDGVVEEIRTMEGFSRFLLPPMFADLQEAARDGPIIMLIASKSSCDAIIIKHTQPPTSILLPTDLEKLTSLVLVLREAIGKDAGPIGNQIALIKGLRKLWVDVVRPVAENLGGFARRGSRIWWCPTLLFNFLPLHAAGEYRANGESLSQQYISSYTPSLTALMRARRSHERSPSVPFAAIGQNCPAGAPFTLDCVEPELDLVRSLLPPPLTVSFTKITSVDATKSRALHALQDNTWLHFSCHGTQNFNDPFKSAFLMRDQPLSLIDITQMDLSLHQFAFLSACETAVGDFATPDEVIHLAAGLRFAGVKSVIGTLWKVTDSTVQRLVEAFYKNLCEDGKMNSKRAAQALHQAVHSLARDKDMPLDQRIVFMHIGA
ncbi:CHAT domain-containing protein [Suillus occidentalis]|nr:CHAT domain-containing protein [Suillus occidentalis]